MPGNIENTGLPPTTTTTPPQRTSTPLVAELKAKIQQNIVNVSSNPNTALEQVKTHNPEFSSPSQALNDGLAEKNKNPMKSVMVALTGLQTGLSRLAGKITRGAKTFTASVREGGQSLAGLIPKFSTPNSEKTLKASIGASKPKVEQATQKYIPPSMADREKNAKTIFDPKKEIERFHEKGLISKAQLTELTKNPPSTEILNTWLETNGGKSTQAEQLKDYPTLLVQARIPEFEKNVSLTTRLSNDIERGLIPARWNAKETPDSPGKLEGTLKKAKAAAQDEYIMARYLCEDFETQIKHDGLVPPRQPKTAATYEEACAIAQKVYEDYAEKNNGFVKPDTSHQTSPRLKLRTWEDAFQLHRRNTAELVVGVMHTQLENLLTDPDPENPARE